MNAARTFIAWSVFRENNSVCITFDHSWSAGVLLVGVGEPLELRLVELGQEARVHRGQLHGLVREGSVEIAHIHWVFLQNDGI